MYYFCNALLPTLVTIENVQWGIDSLYFCCIVPPLVELIGGEETE